MLVILQKLSLGLNLLIFYGNFCSVVRYVSLLLVLIMSIRFIFASFTQTHQQVRIFLIEIVLYFLQVTFSCVYWARDRIKIRQFNNSAIRMTSNYFWFGFAHLKSIYFLTCFLIWIYTCLSSLICYFIVIALNLQFTKLNIELPNEIFKHICVVTHQLHSYFFEQYFCDVFVWIFKVFKQ